MLHVAWHWFEPFILAAIVIVALMSAPREVKYARWFGRLARKKSFCVAGVGLFAFSFAALLTAIRGAPVPQIHDEFAYLLQADTFAHGRLTNPPHELWEFFDTFHVLQRPTYQAKYPPAQAMFLALGQTVGHPVVGVWISFGLFAAALTWMLQAWLPPRWALIGALLMTVRLLAMHGNQQWAYGYWGGSVAALGGALLYGAGRRLWNRPSLAQAIIYSVGLALLANSRPLEGLVASLPISLALAWRYLVQRPFALSAITLRVALPSLVVLSLTFAWMGYYNHRVTGNWKKMPYREHLEQYTQVPIFLWQGEKEGTKTYSNEVTRAFHSRFEREEYDAAQTGSGLAKLSVRRLWLIFAAYLGWLFAGGLVAAAFRRRPWTWFALATFLLGVTLALQTSWFQSHYLAPFVPIVAYVVAAGARRIAHFAMGERAIGASLSTLGIAAYALLAAACIIPMNGKAQRRAFSNRRVELSRKLESEEGKHVVLVQYLPQHFYHHEWVANEADLANAPVIWARDLGRDRLPLLISRYPNRTFWRLSADNESAELIPFAADASAND